MNEWPATEPAPLEKGKLPASPLERGNPAPIRPTTPAVPFEDERTVIVNPAARSKHQPEDVTLLEPSIAESTLFPASSPSSLSSSLPSLQPGPPRSTFVAADDAVSRRHPEAPLTLPEPKSSSGAGIGVIVLLAAIVAGAGWYWFSGWGPATEVLSVGVPAAGKPAATGAVEPAPAAEITTAVASPAASATASVASTAQPALGTSETRAAPARTAVATASAKAKKAQAPAPVVAAAAPVTAAPTPVPAPEPPPQPPAAPQAECAGRNFIAMAQCMVNQCAKAEFKSHPQCDAVRKQQRIDEEKRNPSMAN
ncbi:MAG: hypothetical protein H7340_06150 [Variovorax sp.]|nr:hypothetical protein [Variovorax sp.]